MKARSWITEAKREAAARPPSPPWQRGSRRAAMIARRKAAAGEAEAPRARARA